MSSREWPRVSASKKAIRRAGDTLRKDEASAEELAAARKLAKEWRSAHAYPTNTWQVRMRRYVKDNPKALVAQRLKRLPSIEAKLRRFETGQLDTMQDLGGVRVVVPSIAEVRALERRILENRRAHVLKGHDDYIANPKSDGYRSVHLTFAYGTEHPTPWDGYRVELQLRTQMQHTWATALETVALFTKQRLKSGEGNEYWREFFALMSAEIARHDNATSGVSLSEEDYERRHRLAIIEDQWDVVSRLEGFRQVVSSGSGTSGADYLLLDLDFDEYMLETTGFTDREEAAEAYARRESETRDDVDRDVVLVSVNEINDLPRAYPNYFADLSNFISLVNFALALKRPGEF